MIILAAERLGEAEEHLAQAGYALTTITTPAAGGLRETQAQIARALRLPETAATNLDALADALRDLDQLWDGQQVALLWQDAGSLAQRDGRAWWLLSEILDEADALTVVALGAARSEDQV